MQIIKDINNVVIFAGGPFELTETGMTGPGFSAPTIKSTTHTIEVVDSVPDDWSGGWYTYDGEWTLTAQGIAKRTENLAEAKTAKTSEINTIRYSKIYQASIPYTFPGDTEPDGIQMRDETDRQNIQDFVIDATTKDPVTEMNWMPVSNNLKTMTAAQAIAMGQALKARGDAIVSYSWQLKAQINAATTTAELNAINIKDGWPI